MSIGDGPVGGDAPRTPALPHCRTPALGPGGPVELVFRPVVVGLMIGAIVLGLVELLGLTFPGWNGLFLVPYCTLVAISGHYTYRLMRNRLVRLGGTGRYRLAELFVYYLLLHAPLNLSQGRGNPFAGLPRFDPAMLYAYMLVALAWFAATNTAHDLARLGEPPEPGGHYVPPEQELTTRFLVGGIILLVVTGISRIGYVALGDLARPSVAGPVVNVLVYYVLGVLMLGQMRYTVLRMGWETSNVQVAEGLAGRWIRYTLLFLGAVALLVLLLPTGYTVGLLDLLAIGLSFVFGIFAFLTGLLWYALLIPLGLLSSLFRSDAEEEPPPEPPPFPDFPQAQRGGGAGWTDLVQSLFFWVLVVGVFVWLLRLALRNPAVRDALGRVGPLALLGAWLRSLWRGVRGYAALVREHLPRDVLRRGDGGAAPSSARRRRGPFTAREQVLASYADVLRRARGHGLGRAPGQTPHEYDSRLNPELPSAREELHGLTGRYVEARYGPREVEPEQAGRARADAERVEGALEERRRRAEAERRGGRD